MGRPCFLWRNVSFLRMNLDGAAPVRLLWFPWSRGLYEERCAENLLLGPWKSRMDKLYFTSQKTQWAWAWQHAIRIPSSQPNLWCYRNLCQLSSEKDLNQSTNKQAALYFWNSERENVRSHTHTHLCMWIIYNNSGLFHSVVIVYNLSCGQEWSLEINQSERSTGKLDLGMSR